ncbi:MAG: replication-associated recombination protein A [Ruminococcaceae bacterium]|nr:replication-associated recombination protein A [Oscillospiraceae bacterium]
MSNRPLADRIRPQSFDDMVGQKHLFGERGAIRRIVESNYLPNMIFWGPPGTGKTTAANIIAAQSGMTLRSLNATSASLSDVREVIAETSSLFGAGGILLYLDEIQYFNKKQQQSLLEYMEDGRITLIASTTENPHLYVYNAIISRSATFEFKSVGTDDIIPALKRALDILNEDSPVKKTADSDALTYIAEIGAGDVRRSLNYLENVYHVSDDVITAEGVKTFAPKVVGSFDKSGTVHYDILSGIQKSIRGSDPDATIFYVAKALEGGDLIGVCRRLQVIASEDIGLAYPQAASIVRACVQSAFDLGMPEARIPLANAAILLATAPKSNSAYLAYAAAAEDIEKGKGQNIPDHMRPSNRYDNYKYPHDYPGHYVKQQYLPNDLLGAKYYEYAENKTEQAAKAYWDKIKNS